MPYSMLRHAMSGGGSTSQACWNQPGRDRYSASCRSSRFMRSTNSGSCASSSRRLRGVFCSTRTGLRVCSHTSAFSVSHSRSVAWFHTQRRLKARRTSGASAAGRCIPSSCGVSGAMAVECVRSRQERRDQLPGRAVLQACAGRPVTGASPRPCTSRWLRPGDPRRCCTAPGRPFPCPSAPAGSWRSAGQA